MKTQSLFLAICACFTLQTPNLSWSQQTSLPRKTLAETLGVQVQDQVTEPLKNNALPPTGGALILKEQKVEFSNMEEDQTVPNSCSLKEKKCPHCDRKNCGKHNISGRGVFLNVNYIHSRWNDFSPVLDDGSLGMEFGLIRNIWDNFEGGLGIGWFSGVPNTSSGKSQYYAFYINARSQWLVLDSKFTPTLGLDLNLGSYKVWAVDAESDANITFSKAGSGTLFGLAPKVGIRFQMSDFSNFDLQAGYQAYIDTPQENLGGWMAGISFSFKR